MVKARMDFFNLSLAQLRECLKSWKAPGFRLGQVLTAAWTPDVVDFSWAKFLPVPLRQQLNDSFSLAPMLTVVSITTSPDLTTKVLFRLQDNLEIESVIIPHGDRLTFCISTQCGCALACRFCATGKLGLRRSLAVTEILGQVRALRQLAKPEPTHLVLMGMGEPMQNLSVVRNALDIICHPQTLGFTPKKITVSTSGWLPGILEINRDPLPAQLAFSLNAVQAAKRSWLMPVNRKYPLELVLPALKRYTASTGYPLTLEYILMRDFNDSVEEARVLARLAKNLLAKVNLIPWNPVPGIEFRVPEDRTVRAFFTALQDQGVAVTCRKSRGSEIGAACGQLAGRNLIRRRAA